jgi:hypothetical protein
VEPVEHVAVDGSVAMAAYAATHRGAAISGSARRCAMIDSDAVARSSAEIRRRDATNGARRRSLARISFSAGDFALDFGRFGVTGGSIPPRPVRKESR